MLQVGLVNYSNTLPFLNALEKEPSIQLHLAHPAACFNDFIEGKTDLALLSVSVVPLIKDAVICSNFCIGANTKVDSVLLLSDVPLHEISNITLDYQSRTSVQLVQVLCHYFWKVQPNFEQAKEGFEQNIQGKNAAVVIGDRALWLKNKFKYTYDLAEHWQIHTKLPFVFAVWVAHKIAPEIEEKINLDFSESIQKIPEIVARQNNSQFSKKQLQDYLQNKISYDFDQRKQTALLYFWKLCRDMKNLI